MAKKHRKPTELELLILKVLWNADAVQLPMAVRDVRQKLADAGRDLAHTSVITALNIMVDKKFLKRTKRKNAYFFSPQLNQQTHRQSVIGDVLNRVFDGSPDHLMLALLDHRDVTREDIAVIRRLINRKTKDESKE